VLSHKTIDVALQLRLQPDRYENHPAEDVAVYPRLSNTIVAWMRSPPPSPLLPLLEVVIV
jgi:hypothetical protein